MKEWAMEVEILWVPRHMSIERNQNADEAANQATEKAGTQRCTERFASFVHVGCTISERMWKGAKHWFRTESDRCPPLHRARYDSAFQCQGPDKISM